MQSSKVQMQSDRAFQVIGTPISLISLLDARSRIVEWGRARESRYVVFANVHVTVTASRDAKYGAVVHSADMAVPDGAPVAWVLRRLSSIHQERVSGPDLSWELLSQCELERIPVYFYGSSPLTLDRLFSRVREAFPKLAFDGEAPPFRAPTSEEDDATIARITKFGAGIVFVGLGCPKQENWMASHRGRISAVMLGVGAAFDFHAGTVERAPDWMRKHGLEWLHRLLSEPRRLWKRYLLTNTLFVVAVIKQFSGERMRRPSGSNTHDQK